jgi:futalosine hydrolase
LKRILVVAATTFEIQPFLDFLKNAHRQKGNILFTQNGYEIDVLVTGVGIANTAYQLGKTIPHKIYDLALNVGVAGSFDRRILRGDIVEVISEQYGDLGVEEANGTFTDMFDLGLIDNSSPFQDKKLINTQPLIRPNIKMVHGLTVQKVHGFGESIEKVLKKYKVDVETMEGAAFMQVCLSEKVAFAELRAISNYVEPRNRDNWKMKEAIENLNTFLIELFEKRQL